MVEVRTDGSSPFKFRQNLAGERVVKVVRRDEIPFRGTQIPGNRGGLDWSQAYQPAARPHYKDLFAGHRSFDQAREVRFGLLHADLKRHNYMIDSERQRPGARAPGRWRVRVVD